MLLDCKIWISSILSVLTLAYIRIIMLSLFAGISDRFIEDAEHRSGIDQA